MIKNWVNLFLFKTFIVITLISSSNAITLKESIKNTLQNNPEIISKIKNQEAYRKYIDEEEADYYPTLNLNAYLQDSRYTREYKDRPKSDLHIDGWNGSLTLEHVLYDGGLTPSQVKEYSYNYKANYLKNQKDIEDIILKTVNTYLDIVKYHELKTFSELFIKQQEKNKETAIKKEEISGEKLESYQVGIKFNQAQDKYLDNEYKLDESLNQFKKYVGKEFDNVMCKPTLDESFIPKDEKDVENLALKKSYDVLQKMEEIKKQREKIAQNNANFLPKLSFQLTKSLDKDISLEENGNENVFTAKLLLSWNLFSGGKHFYASQKERLFLEESQKSLENISNDVRSKVDSLFKKYSYEKKKIENLRVQAENSVNVVAIYKKEFEAGTRSLIDILNAQAELFRASIDLIEKEFEIYKTYYELLKELATLNDSILMDNNYKCSAFENDKLKNNFIDKNDTTEDINSDLIAIFEAPKEELFDKNTSDSNLSADNQLIDENQTSTNKNVADENTTTPKKGSDAKSLTEQLLLKIYKELEVESEKTKSIQIKNRDNNKDNSKDEEIKLFKLLKLDKNDFTINLATIEGIDNTYKFIMRNELEDKCIFYSFGKNPKFKVICGDFKSKQQAKNAISKLDNELLKGGPYIDNIYKHQKLFEKYNR